MALPLLLVDDDPLICDALAFVLGREYVVHVEHSREAAIAWVRQEASPPTLALVDLGLPPAVHTPNEGFRLIADLLAHNSDMKILVLSGQNDDAHARAARSLGALDFLAKPCPPDRLLAALRSAQQLALPPVPAGQSLASILVGHSPALLALREQISQFAIAPFPVLITGESGVGKELVARGLHEQGRHARQPFLTVNCAAVAETLFESVLFGHARGAFSGAVQAHAGFFESAGDGVLFLDEIGEMPLELQAKLLRVLENGEFVRVGETTLRKSRARIVAATNRDLHATVRAGRFRADLYYRLCVLTVHVPPLRERGDDRLALWQYYSQHLAQDSGLLPCRLTPEAQALWLHYAFPGNVRELRNIVIRLLTRCAGQDIDVERLRQELVLEPLTAAAADSPEAVVRQALEQAGFQLDTELKRWEGLYIRTALELAQGNVSQAARLLGINRTTLYSRLENLER